MHKFNSEVLEACWPWHRFWLCVAVSQILVLVGVLIFTSSVYDINWRDLSEAIPAFICM
jgi:xanthine/uracil/vitamin C permease (AzgA family)